MNILESITLLRKINTEKDRAHTNRYVINKNSLLPVIFLEGSPGVE